MRNDLYSLVNEFNNMFYDGTQKSFLVDVLEEGGNYKVICEIPGVRKEDIKIEFEDGVLDIQAHVQKPNTNDKYLIHERNCHKLRRQINFGDIKEDEIKASYKDGLLIIDLITKKEEKVRKTIEIQ